MSFRAVSALLAISFITGCSETGGWLALKEFREGDDENPRKAAVHMEMAGTLKDFDVKLRKYFLGELPEGEIEKLTKGLDKALEQFTQFVQGDDPNYYTQEELYKFLTLFFLDGTEVSRSLRLELMKLKKGLFGGRDDRITRAEIDRLRKLVVVLGSTMSEMREYMPFKSDVTTRWPSGKFDRALAEFAKQADRIAEVIDDTTDTYHFIDINNLSREFHSSLFPNEETSPFTELTKNLPLIKVAKSILLTPPSNRLNAADWPNLLKDGSRWYGAYLRLQRFKGASNWFMGSALDEFAKTLDSVFEVLSQASERHPGGEIPFSELNKLISRLLVDFQDIWPAAFLEDIPRTEETLQTLLVHVAPRLIQAGGKKAPAKVDGLGRDAFEGLRKAFESIYGRQLFFQDLFRSLGSQFPYSGDGFDRATLEKNIYATALKFSKNPESFGHERLVYTELLSRQARDIISKHPTMFRGDHSRMTFEWNAGEQLDPDFGDRENGPRSFSQLTYLNIFYELSRVLIMAYAEESPEQGLTEEELKRAYFDFRDLGVILQIFDKRSMKASDKRFLEANLFVYSADGNEFMSLEESTELFAFLFSGKQLADEIHAHMVERCQTTEGLFFQIPGRERIDEQCFKREFFCNVRLAGQPIGECLNPPEPAPDEPNASEIIDALPAPFADPMWDDNGDDLIVNCESQDCSVGFWKDMPGFRDFYLGLGPSPQPAFENFLVDEFIRRPKFDKKTGKSIPGEFEPWIEIPEIEVLATVVHYIEGLFYKYDFNRNGVLVPAEGDFAYEERLKSLLSGMEEPGPEHAEAVFTYALYHGELPTKAQIFSWNLWLNKPKWRRYRADRAKILKVFGEFSKQAGEESDASSSEEGLFSGGAESPEFQERIESQVFRDRR